MASFSLLLNVSTGAQCPVRLSSGGGGQVVVMVNQCSAENQTPDTLGAHLNGGHSINTTYFPFGYCGRPSIEHKHSKIPPMIRPQFEEIF